MSTSKHLFCPETKEATALFRIGGGKITPEGDFSNTALFHFLAYHERLSHSVTFETICIEDGIQGHVTITDLEEIEELKELDEKLEFIIIWDVDNYLTLAGRISGLVNDLDGYDFGALTYDSK